MRRLFIVPFLVLFACAAVGAASRAGMRLGAPVANALARTSTVLGPSQPAYTRVRWWPS